MLEQVLPPQLLLPPRQVLLLHQVLPPRLEKQTDIKRHNYCKDQLASDSEGGSQ